MTEEREFIVRTLTEAGVRGKIHDSMKSLKNCNEIHVGAVLRAGESFERSGSRKRYGDDEGRRMQRNKLFTRTTVLHVVIGDRDEGKVDQILTRFLSIVSKGFAVSGNWVDIEIGDADWMEEHDTILKSRVAVEFDVTLRGGVYTDTEIRKASVGEIAAGQ